MKNRRRALRIVAFGIGAYLLLPLLIFDFRNSATPYDESTYEGRSVVIGPRPRAWIPFATRSTDYPGGSDYKASGWPFRVWKPLCILYARRGGYELPAAWR
jgi:hypothetical protein